MTDGLPTEADYPLISINLAREADFAVGGLTVRPSVREVAKDGHREILEPRVMQALTALARRRGEVVSRDELIATCWEGRVVGDDAINNCVAKVRRLGEARAAFTIETISRVGYRLKESTAPAPTAASKRRASPIWMGLAAAAALVILAILGLWRVQGQPSVRVQVAPFEAAAGDQALAGRVRDSVAGVLSARLVDVAAKDQARGARIVIGGAVERRGGMAHVRVHVDDSRTGLTLWQGEFEGSDAQDNPVADRVAAKTSDLVFNAVKVLRSSRGAASPEAIKAFMLGLENWREGRYLEAANFYRAFRDSAPNVAMAHGAYALALMQIADEQAPEVTAAWRREAGQSADLALSMDPGESRALRARAALSGPGNYAAQQALLDIGLKYSPDEGDLITNQGLLLSTVGRPREALPFIRRGLALDPLSPLKSFGISSDLGMAGLTAESRSALAAAQRIWPESADVPQYSTLFAAVFATPDEGLALIDELSTADMAYAPQAALWRPYLQALKCQCGQDAAARNLRRAFLADAVDPSAAFPALVRLGRVNDAFELLLARPPSGRTSRMLFANVTAPMRKDARFMDVAARAGLAQYWLKSGRWPEFCEEPGLPYDCKAEATRAVAAGTGAMRRPVPASGR